ncbi:hypothetical protein JV173_06705 [Acholeplasma equirhinis]|uniref:hypothetical protein n=1 Tax=Acholeplasma equirhinis TaxID=555393 RepID=UPI00197A7A34|nr:hypothetical protein [Acholeplasma equirhinis]MBN3491190.1 hypothetical protein [Acholeplasma equirhinis]
MNITNYEDLGAYFKKAIERESKQEIEALKAEIEKLKQEAQASIQKELAEEYDDVVKAKTRDITKKYQETLASRQRELDLLVMQKRAHLLDTLFNELFDKIKNFRDTKAYPNWFKSKLSKYNIADFAEIAVNEKDLNLVPKQLKVIVNNDILAGFVLHKKDQNAFVVETLVSNLEAAKEHFYHTAKWFTE